MCYNKTYALKTPTVGIIAVSRMGHDKGRLYAVTGIIDADFVCCADGKTRKFNNPKTKRFKHLKILGVSETLAKEILAQSISDETIRKALQDYPNREKLFY